LTFVLSLPVADGALRISTANALRLLLAVVYQFWRTNVVSMSLEFSLSLCASYSK